MLLINLENIQAEWDYNFQNPKIFYWNKLSIYSSQIEQEAMGLNDSKKDLGWQLGEIFSTIGIAKH